MCDSRLQLLLHLGELLLGHGAFSLPQLLQLLSGRIKVWSRGCGRDLRQTVISVKGFCMSRFFSAVVYVL